MKDILGNEIQVGDTVAYAAARSGAYLTVGRVLQVDDGTARIERIATDYVRDGFYMKWEKANGQYTKVVTTEKARSTRITIGSRAVVVKKAAQP